MAGDAKGIRAGKAFVEVGADKSRLDQVLKASGDRLKNWGKGLAALGAGITVPLVAFGGLFADRAKDLVRISEETGLTVESLTSLSAAAERTGGSMEDVESAAIRMNRFLGEAASGSAEAHAKLAELGLTLQELEARSTGDQMRLLFDRIQRAGPAARQTAAAFGIFGRGIGPLIPLIRRGADGLEDLERAARERGRVISTEEAQNAREFAREMMAIAKAVSDATMLIGAGLVPGLRLAFAKDKDIASGIVAVARGIKNLLVDNAQLVQTLFEVGEKAAYVGAGLFALGTILPFVSRAMGITRIATLALSAAMTLSNPYVAAIVLGVVGLAAGLVFLLDATGRLDPVLRGLGNAWRIVAGDFEMAWGGITDAVMAGDLSAAIAVLSATIQLEWTRLTTFMVDKWTASLADMRPAAEGFFDSLISGLQGLMGGSEAFWDGMRQGANLGVDLGLPDQHDVASSRASGDRAVEDAMAELNTASWHAALARQDAIMRNRDRLQESPTGPLGEHAPGGASGSFSAQAIAGFLGDRDPQLAALREQRLEQLRTNELLERIASILFGGVAGGVVFN